MELMSANSANLTPAFIDLYKKPNTSLNATKTFSKEEAQETAEDFEAFFLSKMMETMFDGISTDGMFGGGHAEKIYRSLLINEYGKSMAKTGTVGVADVVMRSILEAQEMASQGYINGKQEI